jgi:hypothetical protein
MFINPIMLCDVGKKLNTNGFSLRSDFLYASLSYFGHVSLDLFLCKLITFYIVSSL